MDTSIKKLYREAKNIINSENEIFIVARPGFEPRQTAPKTVVLPLYYRANKNQKEPPFEIVCKYRGIKFKVQMNIHFCLWPWKEDV